MNSQSVSVPSRAGFCIPVDAVNIMETLSNLNFLIRLDAEKPELVRGYVDQAEERLKVLTELLMRR